ncbi:MAG: hypothetical protein AAF517_13560 [Planctomycetota bacterium]
MTRINTWLALGLLLAAGFVWRTPTTHADSVVLKNGSTLHGKATKKGDIVVIDFGAAGSLKIPARNVLRIEENKLNDFERKASATKPAATTKPVLVTLKDKKKSSYVGYVVPSSDERILVLDIPGAGKIRVRRADIDKMEDVEPAKPIPAIEGSENKIKTTHLITLKNGSKVRGNVIESSEDGPLKLQIGRMGTTLIRMSDIANIERVDGSIDVEPAATEKVEPKTPGDKVDSVKKDLRDEVLQELLERLINRRIDDAINDGKFDLSLNSISAENSAEEIVDMRFFTRELTRQRNINRVRAESRLKKFGYRALPFLASTAKHPFQLTRRATMRLVEEAGDLRGAPLAIHALTDSDFFVRKHAYSALEKILETGIALNPAAKPAVLKKAQAKYQAHWKELERLVLRQRIEERL